MRSIEAKYGLTYYYGKDEYVGRSIHNYGEFSGEECEKILELSGDGLCLDIGANIGFISQMLLANDRSVVAFEPQPEIFKLLELNTVKWKDRVRCENIALGAYAGSTIMPKVHYSERGNFGGLSCGTRSALGGVHVGLRTLDSYGFDDVSFMKIDVEGFEEQVLSGGEETINHCKPIMYIEDDRVEKRAGLHAMLDYLGYTYEKHVTPLFRENNFFGNKKLIWDKNYVSLNLICRPK